MKCTPHSSSLTACIQEFCLSSKCIIGRVRKWKAFAESRRRNRWIKEIGNRLRGIVQLKRTTCTIRSAAKTYSRILTSICGCSSWTYQHFDWEWQPSLSTARKHTSNGPTLSMDSHGTVQLNSIDCGGSPVREDDGVYSGRHGNSYRRVRHTLIRPTVATHGTRWFKHPLKPHGLLFIGIWVRSSDSEGHRKITRTSDNSSFCRLDRENWWEDYELKISLYHLQGEW